MVIPPKPIGIVTTPDVPLLCMRCTSSRNMSRNRRCPDEMPRQLQTWQHCLCFSQLLKTSIDHGFQQIRQRLVFPDLPEYCCLLKQHGSNCTSSASEMWPRNGISRSY